MHHKVSSGERHDGKPAEEKMSPGRSHWTVRDMLNVKEGARHRGGPGHRRAGRRAVPASELVRAYHPSAGAAGGDLPPTDRNGRPPRPSPTSYNQLRH